MTNPIKSLPDTIETPRLTMRRLYPSMANAQLVFEAVRDENPDDFYFNPIDMTTPIPQDVNDALARMERIEKYAGDNGTWYYIFHNDELIGFRRFYFFDDPRMTFQTSEAWLVRRAWGMGFARETYEVFEKIAFETLGAKRITRQCDTANIRSANSIRASGFHLDGIARGGGLHQDGAVYDNMLWSKLRSEYTIK